MVRGVANEVYCRQCKVMHLGRGNSGWNYVMNGGNLGVVGKERDLGVRITNDLKASAHGE